ncbi:MAG TPA: CoA-binding protein [Dehalococcoidia bacterium]|jgi:acetyltransferase|nr:CoA-binding protein [Dehalococcoidia bacterium]
MTSDKNSNLSLFFEPRSIAVFGSMREPQGEGLTVIRNMLNFGFAGSIYPISRSATQASGLKAYPTVNDVDGPIDLAIVVTPPTTVLPIIDECGQQGVKAAIVATEGFAETGRDGATLQRHLVETARRYGMRLLGPNTLGVLSTDYGLVTAPYSMGYNKPPSGGITYCSQTGFLTFGVHPVKDIGYPISKICDFGNKCDVNELDLLPYLADDPSTNVICMHLEDIKNGQRFMEVARQAVARKPVLILKPGRTEAGARAASSHTGSLAGDDQVHENAFRQAGVIRLRTWREFWDIPKALSLQPLPKGNRIAIVTATGGAGVMLSDAAAEFGLVPATFATATRSQLGKLSPRLGNNPVDVGPMMSVRESPFSVYEDVVPAILSDPNVDCLTAVCHLGPPILKVFTGLAPLISKIGKPVTVLGYGIDLPEMQESVRQMESMGLPTYLDLETSVKALGVSAAYSRIRARMEEDAR